MNRRTPKRGTAYAPEAERAYLAGLLELLTDDAARCREAAELVSPDAITTDGGAELLAAIVAAAALPAPTVADLARIIHERAVNSPPDGHPAEYGLMVDLLEASVKHRGGYARGVDRHAREINRAAGRRRTIEAAATAAEVAADPRAADDEIEAAAVAVAAAAADSPADRLEWQPFPVALLPDPVGTFVTETAGGLGCDATFVALPMLAAVAAAVGNRRRIELWPGWQEPAIVWAIAVAESGSMKTPAADAALRFTRERQRAAFTDHRAALAEWEREAQAERRSRSAAPAGDRPRPERVAVDDLTIESVAPILADNPRGVLLDRDELSGWIGGFDQYRSGGQGGAEAARWLTIYNAGPVTVDRKQTGTVYVDAAHVSIAGGIQPGVLARVAGSRHFENGLVPRFIMAAPPRRMMTMPTGGAGFSTAADMASMFDMLFAIAPGPDGGAAVLDLVPDALEVWKEWWQENAAEQFTASGAEAAMIGKARSWAARLALVCHSIRQAGGEPTLGNRIDADSIERGIGLARWAAREWRRVYRAMQVGGIEADDRALRQWIAARGGMATARDVARGLAQYRAPGRAEAALQRLARSGAAEWSAAPTGGRPADAVRLK